MRRRNLLFGAAAGALASNPAVVLAAHSTSAHSTSRGASLHADGGTASHLAPVTLRGERLALLQRTARRLRNLRNLVGHGHFNLLGLSQGLAQARNHSAVGRFVADELEFLEEIFFEDATRYGFLGAKVLDQITAEMPRNATVKISGSGHYLFKGRSLSLFQQIRRDVGKDVVLTSGVRGVMKQMQLFLSKAVSLEGDLSAASRRLAPPGHSYHGIGDFDVGTRGLGNANFTARFAATDEYRRLVDLGYVNIRYPIGNPYGVGYEPWHVKVV